jgi:hypothetical protein
MPLDAPVTIATLFNSLLIFAIALDPRFETACQHSILHSERIVGNPELIDEEWRGRASIAAATPESQVSQLYCLWLRFEPCRGVAP